MIAAALSLLFVTVAPAAEGLKIGFVNLQQALNESEAGKNAKNELEATIKSKQVIVDEKGKAIEKFKDEMEKQASVLSSEARKIKEADLERMLRDYQRLVTDSQAELKKKEGDITGEIIMEIRALVEALGKQEDYAFILEDVEGMILYSKKDFDITEKVVKKYNESKAKPPKNDLKQ